jgi:hypothetical protein
MFRIPEQFVSCCYYNANFDELKNLLNDNKFDIEIIKRGITDAFLANHINIGKYLINIIEHNSGKKFDIYYANQYPYYFFCDIKLTLHILKISIPHTNKYIDLHNVIKYYGVWIENYQYKIILLLKSIGCDINNSPLNLIEL